MTHGYSEHRAELVNRLHRIEGQVRGIERMVEEDRYCIDVITQISAVTTALESLAFEILDDHVSHCVAGALESGDAAVAAEKRDELLAAVRRFAKTASSSPVRGLGIPRAPRRGIQGGTEPAGSRRRGEPCGVQLREAAGSFSALVSFPPGCSAQRG